MSRIGLSPETDSPYRPRRVAGDHLENKETEGEEINHVGHHYGDLECRRPFEPSVGALFASESAAEKMAAELNSSGGEGATAPHGRYIAVPYRAQPAVKSYHIEAMSETRPNLYIVYLTTDAPDADPMPARFVSREHAAAVACQLEEIEDKGRTFVVAPSDEPATEFEGAFTGAI